MSAGQLGRVSQAWCFQYILGYTWGFFELQVSPSIVIKIPQPCPP